MFPELEDEVLATGPLVKSKIGILFKKKKSLFI